MNEAPASLRRGGRFLATRSALFATALGMASLLGTGCGGDRGAARGREDSVADRRPIEDVLAANTPALMAQPGVVIVYQGALADGAPCIKVGVATLTSELERALPRSLDGYPVVVEETGPIEPR